MAPLCREFPSVILYISITSFLAAAFIAVNVLPWALRLVRRSRERMEQARRKNNMRSQMFSDLESLGLWLLVFFVPILGWLLVWPDRWAGPEAVIYGHSIHPLRLLGIFAGAMIWVTIKAVWDRRHD